jgi:hypothetical protein
MKVVLRRETAKGPPAHILTADTLTAAVGEDGDTGAASAT